MTTNSTAAKFPGLEDVADSALLHEALGRRGALSHEIKSIYPGARVLGQALTVRCAAGDNLMLHVAISIAKPGDVLVATMDGFTEGGAWGEIASLAAQLRGIRGVVLDGAARDVDATARLGFPVFARGVSIKGTTKRQRGSLNTPITIGGVQVCHGDIVVGDVDGVVIVPLAEVGETVAKAKALREKEHVIMQKLREGASTLDLLGLRAILIELGLDQTIPSVSTRR
jgi:4-hydroxy-4-methyl-2-oxoglutarate aldolase